MKKKVINALIELGIPVSIKGFQYIVDTICLMQDKSWRNGKITALYYKVGEMNETTASKVERAIRHAFSVAVSKGNPEIVNKYLSFQNTTNGNLLHTLYLRLTEGE